jgi:hypothetical protein
LFVPYSAGRVRKEPKYVSIFLITTESLFLHLRWPQATDDDGYFNVGSSIEDPYCIRFYSIFCLSWKEYFVCLGKIYLPLNGIECKSSFPTTHSLLLGAGKKVIDNQRTKASYMEHIKELTSSEFEV